MDLCHRPGSSHQNPTQKIVAVSWNNYWYVHLKSEAVEYHNLTTNSSSSSFIVNVIKSRWPEWSPNFTVFDVFGWKRGRCKLQIVGLFATYNNAICINCWWPSRWEAIRSEDDVIDTDTRTTIRNISLCNNQPNQNQTMNISHFCGKGLNIKCIDCTCAKHT